MERTIKSYKYEAIQCEITDDEIRFQRINEVVRESV